MKVVIFGASGQVGLRLTSEMLKRGHHVTAFIYGPNPFGEIKNLRVVRGDIHNADDVDLALAGHDAVLSALGSWGTKSKDILSTAMQHIVPAMQKHGITRIVSLTGADARDLGDKPNVFQKFTRTLFSTIADKVMADGEEHIKTLRNSNLDWTVVRSPVMSNRGHMGSYKLKLSLPMPWATINRSDVVTAMADLVESREFNKQSPIIYKN